LGIALGKELLQFYPDSNEIREELALCYYWSDTSILENIVNGNELLNQIEADMVNNN
jgi:hypothetical protein